MDHDSSGIQMGLDSGSSVKYWILSRWNALPPAVN